MTPALDLAARLLLALLLVVAPSLAVIAPDSPWSTGITDGSDSGDGGDGNRRGQLPSLATTVPLGPTRAVVTSVRLQGHDRVAPRDLAPEPRSSRSPPSR